jgi:hypothetical protein
VYFLDWAGGQLRRIVNAGGGPAAQCPTSPDPFLALGGGVFVDGMWVSRDNPLAAGAGLGGFSGRCPTVQPAADWTCVGGNWLPPGHPLATGTSGTGGTGGSTGGTTGGSTGGTSGSTGGTASCTTTKPGSDWVCVSGNWLPPGHPLATGTSGTGGTGGTTGGSTGGTGAGSTGSCTTIKPASNWVCLSGNWLPPDHPLALAAAGR